MSIFIPRPRILRDYTGLKFGAPRISKLWAENGLRIEIHVRLP